MTAARSLLAVLAAFLLFAQAGAAKPKPAPVAAPRHLANFQYLDSLRVELTMPGQGRLSTWRVTPESAALRAVSHEAGPPPAAIAGASDLIATEDVAWVALAYLKWFEVDRHDAARDHARQALRTLLALQRPDGSFPAWLSASQPERQSLMAEGDWAATARAVQALGHGMRVLHSEETLARPIRTALQRVVTRVRALWSQPGRGPGNSLALDGARLPAWLPGGRADVAAGISLGLLDWMAVESSQETRDTVRGLCDGIQNMQRGSRGTFPWQAILPRSDQPVLWYPDGCFQASALARAGQALNKPGYVSAAEAEVDSLYSQFLASGAFPWQLSPRPHAWPQLPGAAAALAANAVAVFKVTGKERHALTAGLLGSWFAGGRAGVRPYDPSSGRCVDVLTAEGPSASASPGSTARALWTVLEVGQTSAARYLTARPSTAGTDDIVLDAADARPVETPPVIATIPISGRDCRVARMGRENPFWLRFDLKTPGLYRVDMIYLKDAVAGRSVDLRLDGERIIPVSLDVAFEGQFLARSAAIAASDLGPGLHTLGVRASGLWGSGEVVLESFVVHPEVQWRLWEVQPGIRLVALRSLSDVVQTVRVGPFSRGAPRFGVAWDEAGTAASLSERVLEGGIVQVVMPPLGLGVLDLQ